MVKSKVALVRSNTYDRDEVLQAVCRGVELLGGAGSFCRAGEKILLKVNLLVGDAPEKCVTTHPAVLRAVALCLKDAGAILSYGDSPATGFPKAAAKRSGLMKAGEELGMELANFTEGVEVTGQGALRNIKFEIARGVMEADGVISLPKLKTHGLERFTGCIKNQFGCIVGMSKGMYHARFPNALDFGRMLAGLNNLIKPRLYVMDGIMAMEGNGPRGGDPRAMNVLLFSTDPVALDATACRLIGLDPVYVPTTVYGSKSGAGTYRKEEIELTGDPFDEFYTPDFNVERTPVKAFKRSALLPFLSNSTTAKPVIIPERCSRCGTCVNSCPVDGKALNWVDGDKTRPPVYDYNKCIRCYCCQEVCPEKAIILKTNAFRQIISRFPR